MRMIWKPDKRMFLDWPGYLIAIGLVAIITLIKYFAQSIFPPDKALLYMLAIAPTAIFSGLGPAILASVLSVLVFRFFFIAPLFTLGFGDYHIISVLVVFLLVGLIISYLASNLRWKTEESRRLTARLIRAQEEGSKRLAMELHDDTAQTLAYLALELDVLVTKYPLLPEEITQRLRSIKAKIDSTQLDIRRFSHELHPAILENLGLEAALETLTAEMNSKGQVEAEFNVAGREKHLPDETALALYRIAQESLNNILKHSKATDVTVSLQYAANKIKLSVADNGCGFDLSASTNNKIKGGLGLTDMKERAGLIGADFKIETGNGKGTTVSVEAPLPKE